MFQNSIDEATLVIDIGNTNITCGIYQNEAMTWFARFFSSANRTADEYYGLLNSLLKDISLGTIDAVAMASVVPELTRIWQHLFQKYSAARVWEINALCDLGLSYKVADPSFIGGDLIANAYGAWKKYSRDCIVIDLGTATTVEFVTQNGSFEGTAITPGLKTGADQLFQKAALLSQIEIVPPTSLLGTNTRDALLAGIVRGHAFMLESFVREIESQYSDRADILTVATGGIADLVKPLVPSIDIVDKTLTLDGIHLAYQHLKNK
ncbi:MAG: type III pantothenate kinase [Candidatus Syntrophosphaera sp.]|nr:type III pantothenate kinase [Candidatus Syntrophosphaera sp.]